MGFVRLESACKKQVKHQAQFKKSFSVLVDCSPHFCLALLVFLPVPSYFSVSHPSQEVSHFLVLCHIVYSQEWHLQFQSKWVELCERSFSPCRLSVVVVIRKNVKGGLCKRCFWVFFFPLVLLFFRDWLRVFLCYSWLWYLNSLNPFIVLIAALSHGALLLTGEEEETLLFIGHCCSLRKCGPPELQPLSYGFCFSYGTSFAGLRILFHFLV